MSCLEEMQKMEQKLSLPLKPRDLSEIQLLKVLMLVEQGYAYKERVDS